MQRIRRNKILHSGMVAEYMRARAVDYGINPEYAYVTGLLHDVGYIHGRKDHATSGAAILSKLGMAYPITEAVRLHGVSPYRVTNSKLSVQDLRSRSAVTFNEIDPLLRENKMLTLLLEADMRVDKEGELVGFQRRKADLFSRYDDPAIRENIEETIKYVFEWCNMHGIPEPPSVGKMSKRIYEKTNEGEETQEQVPNNSGAAILVCPRCGGKMYPDHMENGGVIHKCEKCGAEQ